MTRGEKESEVSIDRRRLILSAWTLVLLSGPDTAVPDSVELRGAVEQRRVPLEMAVRHTYVAESSVRLDVLTSQGESALHWIVTVDHFGGEAAYPVGWPRFGIRLPDGWRDWSAWERLRLRWRVESSRQRLPARAIGFQIYAPDRASSHLEWFEGPPTVDWHETWIEVETLNDPTRVTQVQWHISESEYRHGDRLDVWIAEMALERAAEPTVDQVRPECAYAWADTPALGATVRLTGLRPDTTATVSCELVRHGKLLAKRTAVMSQGTHRLSVRAPAGGWGEGLGDWITRMVGTSSAVTVPVHFVVSPWSEQP